MLLLPEAALLLKDIKKKRQITKHQEKNLLLENLSLATYLKTMPFDLKALSTVLGEFEAERGVSKDKMIDAIEQALATAYKKEYGKRDQVVRVRFDMNTGTAEFEQVKTVVDDTTAIFDEEVFEAQKAATENTEDETEKLPLFNPEKHILIDDARRMKKDVELGEEIIFPLEAQDDFGRIAAQTAKQVIIQKIREAEKEHLYKEFGAREGEIVSGTVQRIERGNIFVDLDRATGVLAYDEQIPGERYRQGERIRAYLFRVEESPRGVFLRLSRSHPNFLIRLFETEAPEVAQGIVEIKAIAREPGSRSKIAVAAKDANIDPVGALVGQRGVRVSTVMGQLGGEKIDVIEWSETPEHFIEDALSPAKVLSVEITDAENHQAVVTVTDDQQSLAIGRGGQNVRLAAKLTGWRIDIKSAGPGDDTVGATPEGEVIETTDDTQPTIDNNETVSQDETSADDAVAATDDETVSNESSDEETTDETVAPEKSSDKE